MATIRQQLYSLLCQQPLTARDLSRHLGLPEKKIYEHLPHVARSAAGRSDKLVVCPFACLECGFVFKDRKRYTRPGRCPRCRGTHVEPPLFQIKR